VKVALEKGGEPSQVCYYNLTDITVVPVRVGVPVGANIKTPKRGLITVPTGTSKTAVMLASGTDPVAGAVAALKAEPNATNWSGEVLLSGKGAV